ncbi:T9SS sorting signal type C domain-containing protein [Flavobacterium sp. DG2-3]|uniref:T9SS sorting signal type C domain-containing protein n=1 Tax=Flavobacterium sp. DG2-3 TaxID=3068317 RepID=UPI00273E4BAB|nr:T9SS sorting signal type C domain-containing protein [Flavobacterium sp. DG2-3]MDP5198210.1 T9SS sorting signal type C domain-containing protein [Flavobacterium sp. DG2-3]
MKKDLLIMLNFFSFSTLVTYIEKQLKFGWSSKILVVLILLFSHTALKAQIITRSVAVSDPSFLLPAGIDVVTVEAWGAGGAGGAARVTPLVGRSGGGGGGGAYARGTITTTGLSSLNVVVGPATAGGTSDGASGGASYITGFTGSFNAPGGFGGNANIATTSNPTGGNGGVGVGNLATGTGGNGTNGSNSALSAFASTGAGGNGANFGSGGGAGGPSQSAVILTDLTGTNGSTYGGGGGGAMSANALRNGGSGARGHVNITYTCKTYSLTGISAPNVCTGTTTQVQLTGTAASLPVGTYTVRYNTSRPNAVGLTANMVVTTAGSGSFTATGLNSLGNSTITVTSLTSVDCVSTLTANNVVNIIVSALPTITLGTVTPVCASASLQNVTLPYTAVTNDPTNYSITWNASPTNSFLPVTNAALTASPVTIAVPAGTAPGTYTGSLTVRNAAGCVSAAPSNFTITVNPLPTITLGATTAVCVSSSAQSTTLPYTAVANSPTTYSITWNASPVNSFVAITNVALPASPINISIPAGTAAGTYTGTLTVRNANGCVSSGNNFTITVNPLPTITLGTAAVCFNASSQTASLSYSAATNSPTTYSITWNASPANSFATVTNAALTASPISITVPAGTAVGTYSGTLTVRNANGCVSAANNFTVTVNPLPTITLGTAASVCTSANAQNTALPYTAVTNSPTMYSITWNASPANSFVAITNVALPASPINIAVPAGTPAGAYTGILTVRNANGCVSSANNFMVTVNPLPTITLGTAAAVCTSTNAQNTALPYTAVTNSPTTYSITWNASPANSFAAVTNVALPASPINIAVPAGTPAGAYTGVLTVRNANGCVSSANNFTVTVNPLPTITLGTATAVCTSTSAQNTLLPYGAVSNSPTTYSITWNASPTNSFVPVTEAALTGSPINIAIPAGTTADTYTGTLTVKNANGCISSGNNFAVTVNPLPTITLGTAGAVCFNNAAQNTNLSYNAVTNSPTTYSITWNASPANSFVPVTDAALTASPINIAIPAGTTAGTYTGTLTVKNANGCLSAPNNFTVTVNPLPVAPTASATQQPTCVNNTGIITVTSPASGTGYTYSIDGVDFSNSTGIFIGLSSGLYNVQVKNSATGCESLGTQITINASVTKVWNGSANANWGNPANWTPTGVPIATDCIDIPDVGVDPVISGTNASFFASRLTIQNNGSLIVNGTNTITVTNEVNVLGNGVLIFENNSSLVQIADVSNTGNIIYKRNTTPVRRYDVTYWSSPVTRDPVFTLYDLSPNTLGDKFHKFNPVNQKWIVIGSGAEEMVKGNGYSIRAPQFYDLNSTQIFGGEFKGVPNNGTILGPEAVAENLTFLGNPYPSAIYADEFIADNSARLYGTLYFWTHNSLPIIIPGTNTFAYTSSDFAYYNLSGETEVGQMEGTPAPTPGNQSTPAGYIAAGQGFFAKSLTGERVVFTNSMRVPNLNSQFYKASSSAIIEKHRVWLNLTNTEAAFKQLLIGYVTGATNSWDNSYDATTMNANPYVDFYSVNDGKKLVIQGRAVPFVVTDTIPLGYKSTIPEGNFTIAIDRADGDLSNQNIYLQDNLTNTIHNLKTGGYTFTSAPGTFLNRFVLRYTSSDDDKTLGNEDFENQDQKIFVSVKDKNIKLQSISEQENLEEAAIYDTGGKLLYRKKEIGNREWIVTNFQSGPQVLLVKVTLDSGKTITKKIVFQ